MTNCLSQRFYTPWSLGGSELFMYGFIIKIKTLLLAKALPTGFFKGVSIYKAFINLSSPANKSGLNAS